MAVFRFGLILIPFFPLFLISMNTQHSLKSPPAEIKCFVGLTPSFLKNSFLKKQALNHPQKMYYPLIAKKDFFKQISLWQMNLKKQGIASHHLLIVLPLYLTKDNSWMISQKSFIFSKNHERIEISHISLKDLQESYLQIYKNQFLILNHILKSYPKASLLLKLQSTNDINILKHLHLIKNHKSPIYLFSSNEKLLQKIFTKYPQFFLLHSFKKLIRFQLMNFIPHPLSLLGEGLLIPSNVPLSNSALFHIHKQNKIVILETKDSQPISNKLINSINGLVSSDITSAMQFIAHKKSCFLQ